ncbi:hypothetical protein CAPTEDRAFT_103064, partial [Capitella teleta]
RAVGHRNPASGSSRIASSAYQKWPTWSSRFPGAAQQSSRTNSRSSSSYPEGNFGGNQLLDGSISLSPLYPSQTNDLHVIHHLSGPDRYAHSNPSQKIKVGRRCTPRGGSRQSASLRLAGLLAR